MTSDLTTGPRFHALTRSEDIDRVVEESRVRPVVLLKHSLTCGTSEYAYDEVLEWLASPQGALGAYLIDVRADRVVSRELANRFGIRHESPQLLLLDHGEVRWSASHYRVTRSALEAALHTLATPV